MKNIPGWFINFYPSPFSGNPYSGGRFYSSRGFPIANQIENMVAQHPLRHVRQRMDGSWIIICANNNLWFSPGFPADIQDLLTSAMKVGMVDDIFFLPNDEWVAKIVNQDGSRTYQKSDGFPSELMEIINNLDLGGKTAELLALVFPPPTNIPAPIQNGLTNVMWNSGIVLCDKNQKQAFNNPPQDFINQINAAINMGRTLRGAVFSSSTGWLIWDSSNFFWANDSFDRALLSQIRACYGDLDDDHISLYIEDVLIVVPTRSITFQVTSIDAQTVRSGGLSARDTLFGQMSVQVDNNPPVTTFFSFGNWIESKMVIGLNGLAPGMNPQSPLVSTDPAGPPTQLAMQCGPVTLTDPNSKVAFSYTFINRGQGGQGFMDTALIHLAGNAIGLVSNALNTLVGSLGIPGLNSITGALLSAVQSDLQFGSGCDGLVAADSFTMTGSALMALDYNTKSENLLQQAIPYNNVQFPDGFTGSKSPYDSSGGWFCNAPTYIISSAILCSDTEQGSDGFPTPQSKTTVLNDFSSFASGVLLNGVDTTPQSLCSCEFLDNLYVFWKANDASNQIFFSLSSDGVNWPNGQVATLAGNPGPSLGTTPLGMSCCVYTNQTPQTQLYLFWKSNDASNRIYYSICTDGSTWQAGHPINQTDTSPQPPAACAFQGKLFLFWTANDPSHLIYASAYDGATNNWGLPTGPAGDWLAWPAGKPLTQVGSTTAAPTACVFNNKLFLFWPSTTGAINLSTCTDPANLVFTPGKPINSTDSTPASLAACVYQGQLYLFWKSNDSGNAIYFSSSSDGQNWVAGQRTNDTDSTPLSLTATPFGGKVSLIWKSNDNSNRIFTTLDSPSVFFLSQT